jgi:hypothetical protein
MSGEGPGRAREGGPEGRGAGPPPARGGLRKGIRPASTLYPIGRTFKACRAPPGGPGGGAGPAGAPSRGPERAKGPGGPGIHGSRTQGKGARATGGRQTGPAAWAGKGRGRGQAGGAPGGWAQGPGKGWKGCLCQCFLFTFTIKRRQTQAKTGMKPGPSARAWGDPAQEAARPRGPRPLQNGGPAASFRPQAGLKQSPCQLKAGLQKGFMKERAARSKADPKAGRPEGRDAVGG